MKWLPEGKKKRGIQCGRFLKPRSSKITYLITNALVRSSAGRVLMEASHAQQPPFLFSEITVPTPRLPQPHSLTQVPQTIPEYVAWLSVLLANDPHL